MVYLATLPTLKNIFPWFSGEAQTAIFFIAIAIFIFAIAKQRVGMAIGSFIVSAFTWFYAGSPETLFKPISEILKLIFGG